MALDLSPFADAGLDRATLDALMGEHDAQVRPGLERLWSYYRNAQTPAAGWRSAAALRAPSGGVQGRGYRLAQEQGLPARLTSGAPGRETVVENDIAWRIDALVDMAFGKPPMIRSDAEDPATKALIEAALEGVWQASGGQGMLQDMALLGMVYGHVDLLVRPSARGLAPARALGTSGSPAASSPAHAAEVRALASDAVRIELVEAPRAIPVLDPSDYRVLSAYVIRSPGPAPLPAPGARAPGALERVLQRVRGSGAAPAQDQTIEILSASHRHVYAGGRRVIDEPSALGVLPIVHVQNASQPFRYAGLSDVEPLIPLQDELNTRLSDRAHRVTLQSFNMYLAKGLESPASSPANAERFSVGPGVVWLTDNPDADIKAFGGDGHSPSEDRHIDELRDAMDKTSAVSPVVIGVIRERLGHLSSENALRITLMGILSKTARRRQAYGRAIEQASRLALNALDIQGVVRTTPAQRGVRVQWPDPLPTDERSRLAAAQLKRDLGVPSERVLAELGYGA